MENLKSSKFYLKVFLFVLGMFVSCYGITITIISTLGTSPITAPALAATKLTPLTIGMTTFLLNTLFLVGQIIILRKKFKPIQLIQLPIAFLIGVFMDLCVPLTSFIHVSAHYWVNLLMNVFGSFVLGLGVAIEIYANLTYMPGDGLVNVIYEETGWNFGAIKVSFDVTLAVITILMCWLGSQPIFGDCIREGSIISALTVGVFADMFLKLFKYKKSE